MESKKFHAVDRIVQLEQANDYAHVVYMSDFLKHKIT